MKKIIFAALMMMSALQAMAAMPRYTVTMVDESLSLRDVNSAGVALALAPAAGGSRQAALVSGETVTYLGNLGGSAGLFMAFNDHNMVVGSSTLAGDTASHAFVYANGTMKDIGTLGGISSEAVALNNDGLVGGNYTLADGTSRAFLYTQQGGAVDIGTLGGAGSKVTAISRTGEVLGKAQTASGEWRNFLYNGGVMTQFTDYSETFQGFGDHGEIWSTSYDDHEWTYQTSLVRGDLDLPDRMGIVTEMTGNYVYGWDSSMSFPVLLINGTDLYSLDELAGDGWSIYSGSLGMSSNGYLVAYGCNASRGLGCGDLLLSPVPEPVTYAMLVSGLALLALRPTRSAGRLKRDNRARRQLPPGSPLLRDI